MGVPYDPNQDEDVNFGPVPIGEHRVQITEAEDAVSKQGNAMIKLTCKVLTQGYENRLLWDYIVDGEFASSKIGKVCESCGIPKPAQATVVGPEMFYQKVGTVQVKHEQYRDKTDAKINYWVTPSADPGAPPHESNMPPATPPVNNPPPPADGPPPQTHVMMPPADGPPPAPPSPATPPPAQDGPPAPTEAPPKDLDPDEDIPF